MGKVKLWLFMGGLLLIILGVAACVDGVPVFGDLPDDSAGGAVAIQPESCSVCHSGVGAEHQAVYDGYTDASTLELTIDSVTSVADGAGAFNATMTFTIMKDHVPYIDVDGLPSLEQKRFYAVTYDSATKMFDNSKSFGSIVALGNGQYTATAEGIAYDLNSSNGQAYAYIADGPIHTEPMGHVHLYDDVASAALAFGDVATYESPANVSGCENCHGAPYMKHGYRDPVVDGLSDFSSCKSCHYDTRTGGHQDWQMLVDDPARYAELSELAGIAAAAGDKTADSIKENMTEAELEQYAYKARLMNDVHMAHSMEFPYPQSISNCATCHEGKLDMVLTDANYTAETCKSCHPVTGPEEGTDPHRAPALATIMPLPTHEDMDVNETSCGNCHREGNSYGAPVFSEVHAGYDEHIYTADGTKYSEIFTVSVDSASLSGNILTIGFSANESVDVAGLAVTDILPTLMIGLYGYDTHQYIVASHERDEEGIRLEFVVDAETVNPRFTLVSAAGGSWEVTVDLSMYADIIADGIVKRVEIGIMPDLRIIVGERDSRSNGESDDTAYALNAPSRTFDLGANAFDDTYYKGDNAIIDVEGCNTCHDALATTFHSPNRGGNIQICKMCHYPSSRGSHLELASRSIDNYVHAIHSFQPFDPGDVDFTDPVEAVEYEHHVAHVFPNFTIKNCEACHNPGTYDVPDQTKSLPSLHSGTDEFDGDRNIGTMGQFVTGPASRACGSCHRAKFLKEDDVAGLVAFNQHTNAGGYMVDDGEGVWAEVVKTVMAFFN